MKKTPSLEMQKIISTKHRNVEVEACPGSGKTTVAVGRVAHILAQDPASRVAVLSFSNSAVRTIENRLKALKIEPGTGVMVLTCHSLANRLASARGSEQKHMADAPDAFKQMLKQGIRTLKTMKAPLPLHHLLVDEYQDCTSLQRKFIALLARRVKSVVVLGDRMQSIYGFIGVSYSPLSAVVDDVKLLPLSMSYRLTPQIAALANAISKPRGASKIQVHGRDGLKPQLVHAADTTTQAQWVARQIQKLLKKGVSPKEIAVLGRNRATPRPAAQALRALGINSTLLGQTTGHDEQVLDVIALLQVVGVTTVEWLAATRAKHAKDNKPPPHRELKRRHYEELATALADTLDDEMMGSSRWPAFVKELQKLVESGSVDMEGRFNACAAAYMRLHGGVRADKALRNDLNAWGPVCRKHQSATTLEEFARSTMSGSAVTVTNIHQAKGMEWDYVFVVGVTDGVLPDFRAEKQDSMDLERSLLYVAITRARKQLWLCHAPTFGQQARASLDKLSRLVDRRRVLKTMEVRTPA